MARMLRSIFGSLAIAAASVMVLAQAPTPDTKKTDDKKEEKKDEKKDAPSVPNSFFPSKKGTKWSYANGESKIEMAIGEKGSLETLVNGKKVAEETIEVKADGIYRTKVNGVSIEPAIKVLQLPLSDKDVSWDVSSKLNAQEIKGKFTQKAAKEKYKKGTIEGDAVVVDGPEFMIATAKCSIKQWFIDGKYVCKMVYSIAGNESMIELTDFVEGK
jgi:hypothetical protein